MQSDILFDNIYIGHSAEEAEKLKNATFDIKTKIEAAEEEASKPQPPEVPKSPLELNFLDDPVKYVREKVDLFYTMARNDPMQAVKLMPEVAGGIGAVAVTVLALLVTVVTMSLGGATPPPQIKKAAEKVKESALDAKDQVVDAATSGAEKVQAEVNKRTTRSSGPAE